jgi:hypothetical protein
VKRPLPVRLLVEGDQVPQAGQGSGASGCDPSWSALEAINADEGVRWLFSFLSADRLQPYCLYEAPSPDELVAAARRAGIPADVIVEVSRISPEMVA